MPVWLVFDHDDIVSAADGVDLLFAGEGGYVAGWVVALAVIWVSCWSGRLNGGGEVLDDRTHAMVYMR